MYNIYIYTHTHTHTHVYRGHVPGPDAFPTKGLGIGRECSLGRGLLTQIDGFSKEFLLRSFSRDSPLEEPQREDSLFESEFP